MCWEVDVATTSVASQTIMLAVQTHLNRGKHQIGSTMAPKFNSGSDKLWVLVSPNFLLVARRRRGELETPPNVQEYI